MKQGVSLAIFDGLGLNYTRKTRDAAKVVNVKWATHRRFKHRALLEEMRVVSRQRVNGRRHNSHRPLPGTGTELIIGKLQLIERRNWGVAFWLSGRHFRALLH